MLTIAQIAAAATAGTLGQLSDQAIADAGYAVQFARNPAFLGDEPHLRHEEDPCGLDDDGLAALDQAVWAELAAREDARIAANWRQGPIALPLAA